ncbi:MAG: SRPBCC domain-containing protein, partial [Pseudomonadota bacterium]
MSTDFQTFCISRRFGVRQATLWQAWTDPETKRRWFAWEEEDGDWRTEDYRIDFRTGGTESARQVGP